MAKKNSFIIRIKDYRTALKLMEDPSLLHDVLKMDSLVFDNTDYVTHFEFKFKNSNFSDMSLNNPKVELKVTIEKDHNYSNKKFSNKKTKILANEVFYFIKGIEHSIEEV